MVLIDKTNLKGRENAFLQYDIISILYIILIVKLLKTLNERTKRIKIDFPSLKLLPKNYFLNEKV